MTNNNGAMRVRRSDKAVWRVIDGDVVVLNPEDAMLHALKGCGRRVWELIESETAISEVLNVICDEYDVKPERAREEITEFIHKLEALKLVEIVSLTSKEANR